MVTPVMRIEEFASVKLLNNRLLIQYLEVTVGGSANETAELGLVIPAVTDYVELEGARLAASDRRDCHRLFGRTVMHRGGVARWLVLR